MKSARSLRNSTKTLTLAKNPAHQFSARHALSIYPLDAVYTFIPKNACSTLRFSTSVANGYLSDLKDINWIHNNNAVFISTKKEISCAKYTFVVLRCPFRRLASCFFDKFVGGSFHIKRNKTIDDVSFSQFIDFVYEQNREQMNPHWRHQVDFLHYAEYDSYFSLERFSDGVQELGEKGFEVYDTRGTLTHDKSDLVPEMGDFSLTPISELKVIKQSGSCPTDSSFYNSETYNKTAHLFKNDINLYIEKFGKENILRL